MFNRYILSQLREWAGRSNRKPLVIRGARQVGKTTAVRMFAQEFDQFISLNLERTEERKLFEREYSFADLLISLFLYSGKRREGGRTLLFIDEIQNSPKAISLLRFFLEDAPDLYVISAGSLLESVMNTGISFPVGRVEFMAMHPCHFGEFLQANGQERLLDVLMEKVVPAYAHEMLMDWYRRYATTGGMPEVVNSFANQRDLTALAPLYDALVQSYRDDAEKYASSSTQVPYIRHVMGHVFGEAGTKITFEKFANSPYRSREIRDAFAVLEKAMILRLLYPTTSFQVPVVPNLNRKPRLQVLDTGLVNHVRGLMGQLVFQPNITDVYRGMIAEHIVGQELLASSVSVLHRISHWVREKKGSSAEVDFVLPFQGHLIPVEVKSGTIGKLKSLHLFMDQVSHSLAVRVWQGTATRETVRTPEGKQFTLLSIPFYLAHRMERVLEEEYHTEQ